MSSLNLKLQGIIFDFDGVILDSVDIKTRAFSSLFSGYPEHLEAIVRFHLEQGGLSRYRKFEIIYREFLHLPLSASESQTLGDQFSKLVFEEALTCPFINGADQCLRFLATDFRLFIASGTPQDELRRIVEGRNLSSLFAGIYGSPTSKADIIQSILREYGWSPEQVVMIGDAINDLQAAQECGVPFIGRHGDGYPLPFAGGLDLPAVRDLAELQIRWKELIQKDSGISDSAINSAGEHPRP
jgi:phosphoglycolate phosphatase-like HAD superfamily hydrolase